MSIAPTHYRTPVLPTPFHSRSSRACQTNEWSRWAGYTTPERYTDVEVEYAALRGQSTLFDLSPMIKYHVHGPEAEAYLERLLTRRVAGIGLNRVAYVVWCDDRGKVLDDGTLFRLGRTEFRLCCQDRHYPWLLDTALGYDVRIEDETGELAALALQGPTSCRVLKSLGWNGIERLRPFHLRSVTFEGASMLVSRTGFTGDLGYELWLRPDQAEPLWDRLMEVGELHGLRPIGSRALDLARIEAGFLMPHTDFVPAAEALRPTRGRSPFELGLDWLVDLDKGQFVGRRALVEERLRGSKYRIVGLDVQGNRPAHDAFVYHDQEREAGHVTSATWSPVCKRNLAIATLRSQYLAHTDNLWVQIYVSKELKWEKRMVRAYVVERPFFDPPRRWATPAWDF